ncbi:hypothetical protein BX666DRAFT_2024778 [Dichotomocladium elegans]|nr:hypothetical protein BX666DRAFT_2024778 [Dichotomocladium elegans]
MSSSLTFQLRQHQQEEEQKHSTSAAANGGFVSGVGAAVAATAIKSSTAISLPSPPSSSYGDESSSVSVGEKEDRRDSLPTHFNALTLQSFSTSLPENYTIEHSVSPIPIAPSPLLSSSPRVRHKHHQNHHRAESPSFLLSPTATAAGTGGLTIRGSNARMHASSLPSCPSSSPSYSTAATLQHSTVKQRPSTSATTTKALHRCEDCGKVYKHPNCLAKHRWEHSEEWELTSKLLLTKHQQVQMLEAAAILVSLDTQRVEQQQQRILEQQRRRATSTDTEEEDDNDDYDDDDESIHIDDDGDDNDADGDIIVDMEMDEETSPVVSAASSSTISSPTLLPNSFPSSDG